MVRIMNLIYGNFSPEHKWDAIPSVGIGYMTVFPHKGTPTANMITTNFGVPGKYRIQDNWDVNLSVQLALFSELFDSRYIGKNYDCNLEVCVECRSGPGLAERQAEAEKGSR